VLDLGSDDDSVNADDDFDMEELEFQHDHFIYTTPEGVIPTLKHYKYLGVTLDTRLGDPRKIYPGEKSMELDFAHSQAKKGMKVLHALRPFLTDRFCPLILKVALVRNLVYSKMLYGAELIGFQKLHADPMQRVINTAAKWILGLQRNNTTTDAFTLCFELSLPPVHQELCALRARLSYKLNAHTDGGLHTWLQLLWDQPPRVKGNHQTWVSLTKKWLKGLEKDRSKYARIITGDAQMGRLELRYQSDLTAPLRLWAQLSKALEMRVRANSYTSQMQRGLRTAFLGTDEYGELANVAEAPI
jgi:hypothetical protein